MRTDYPAIRPEYVTGAKLYANRHQMILDLGIPSGGIIAEIGVATGNFSDFLMRELKPAHFYALDLFNMHNETIHWGVPQAELLHGKTHLAFYRDRFAALASRMTVIAGPSVETVQTLVDAAFDLIYIDANHDYEPVKHEAAVSAQKIKRNGILIFNDYTLYDPFIRMEYGVVQAVNEMLDGGEWQVLGFALDRSMFCDIAIKRA
jgi:hypothetical protein